MTEAELQKLVDHAYEFATDSLVKDGKVIPLFIGDTDDGSTVLVPFLCEDRFEKQILLAKARQAFKEHRVHAYTGMFEMWFISGDKDDRTSVEGEYFKYESLEEHPNRKEGLLIFATDGERVVTRMYEMVRDWKGKLRELKDEGGADLHSPEGTFLELLN